MNRISSILKQLALLPGMPSGAMDDSRQVRPGDLFLAYPGQGVDRRKFISRALDAGACAVLWEPGDGFEWNPDWAVPNLAVAGLRALSGPLAHELAGHPGEKLDLLAVTGTNGKTTVSQCLARVYPELCTVVGTLGAGFVDQLEPTGFTTPEATTLARLLAEQVNQGARACALEASSIGIEEGRLGGVRVDTAIFTNLTQDHLDYHGTMEAYGKAKEKLFQWPRLRLAVINLDDAFGRHLARVTTAEKVLGYTLEGRRDIPAVLEVKDVQITSSGQAFQLNTPWGSCEIKTSLVGRFNVANLMAVAAVLLDRGLSLQEVSERLLRLQSPPGRMERYGGVKAPLVMVDYAHTPDALLNALTVLRPVAAARGGRLLCVFGCGGERDKSKRPIMGQVATSHADEVWVTSDNPRSENPLEIIQEICRGAPTAQVEANRALAITQALMSASEKDVILVAGKGHETYQEIAGIRHPFIDGKQVAQALAVRTKNGGNP